MKPETAETVDWTRVVESLEAIRQEMTRLGERVAALEAALATAPRATASAPAPAPAPAPALAIPPRPEPAPQPQPEPEPEGLSEELVLVISAAIAAFLGKKPHIRQIRLLGSPAWAEHGRVTIQASHALSTHHGQARSSP
jgi:methylmalonyl-CoA carboxyltransferase large subunit